MESKHSTLITNKNGSINSPSSLTSSPSTSAAGSQVGLKRPSEPESPLGEKCILVPGTIGAHATEMLEDEWARSLGNLESGFQRLPPFPLRFVGRVIDMAQKFVHYLQEYFLQRPPQGQQQGQTSATESKMAGRFRRKHAPSISLKDYVLRICNYVVAIEPAMLLTILSYAHLLDPQRCEEKPSNKIIPLCIDSHTVHRFVITGLTLSSKAIGDQYYSNAFYAKVGGVSTKELNCLELELAMMLDWKLQCPYDKLCKIWNQLESLEDY